MNSQIDPYFVYLNWRREKPNKRLHFHNDNKDSISTLSTIGPYKNAYSELVFQRNKIYLWQIQIEKGSYFKIGILKESEIGNEKLKAAFSDSKLGYALMSNGKLRHGSNKDGADFGNKKGYGPGDTVTVKLDTIKGHLYFAVNDWSLEKAFTADDFKKGGYVAAVASLHEDSKYSLTLPNMED